jgi:RNA polymerase sigma-70 factor, ECF subfamily
MQLKDTKQLLPLLHHCVKGHRRSQNRLYELAFPYAMSVALRYGANREDSLEIVNEAFFKMFNYLKSYDPSFAFTTWLRRIIINTAIDHFNLRQRAGEDTDYLDDEHALEIEVDDVLDRLHAEDLLAHVQQLPPTYRLVFSLFAIEGYSHKEIAAQLGVTEGASKSNYHKARLRLQQSLKNISAAPKKLA